MKTLAVVVPTRGRPDNAARLAEAFTVTTTVDAVPVFVADRNDPALPEYEALMTSGRIPRLVVHTPREGSATGMCAPLNYAATRYARLYDAVGFLGDDHLPRTVGWDAAMLAELDAPEPRIAYSNDLLQGAALPTAVFLPSRMVNTMGVMAPMCLRHLYLDNFWKELGEQLGGLRYRADVVIEHMHPIAGKAAWDARYADVNAPDVDLADRNAWTVYRDGTGFQHLLTLVRQEYARG